MTGIATLNPTQNSVPTIRFTVLLTLASLLWYGKLWYCMFEFMKLVSSVHWGSIWDSIWNRVPWLPKSQKPPSKSSSSSNIQRGRQVLIGSIFPVHPAHPHYSPHREHRPKQNPPFLLPDLSTVRFCTPGAAVHPACQPSTSPPPAAPGWGPFSSPEPCGGHSVIWHKASFLRPESSGQHSEEPSTFNITVKRAPLLYRAHLPSPISIKNLFSVLLWRMANSYKLSGSSLIMK